MNQSNVLPLFKKLKTQLPKIRTRAFTTFHAKTASRASSRKAILETGHQRQLHINEFPCIKRSTIRWGIAPVSLMAEDFAKALSVLPADNHKIMSCVAPNLSKSLAFADKYNVQHVYDSYEDLARCADVDAVYISTLNPLHCELCHLMLNHNKHVLCEKPLCMAEHQVEDLLYKARSRKLFLMEGMWPRCVPAYHYLRHQIMRNHYGHVDTVHCTLGLPVADSKLAQYGGVTKDFAIYGIQLALWVFREVPLKVKTSGTLNEDDVDVTAYIELTFSGDRHAYIEVSAERQLSNEAVIIGSKRAVKMSNYWCPTRMLDSSNTEYVFPLPESPRAEALPTHYHNRLGMCYEAEEVRNCVLNGRIESEVFNHKESLLLANLTDTIHELLGTGRFTALKREMQDQEESAMIEKTLDLVCSRYSTLGRAASALSKVFGRR